MADKDWRTNQGIQTAKQITKKLNKKAVIILSFDATTYELFSYGENGEICKLVGELADKIHELIQTDILRYDELDTELRR